MGKLNEETNRTISTGTVLEFRIREFNWSS